jgi:antitoxin component YwqK of YwqJK toxin-antitoxin module
MRKQILLLTLFITLVMIACEDKPAYREKPMGECSYELTGPAGKDTVNLTYDGKKEGHWVIKDHVKVKVSLCKDSTHKDADKHVYTKTVYCVTEEGFFKNNLKEGLWVYYNTDGSAKDSVVYKNGEVVK